MLNLELTITLPLFFLFLSLLLPPTRGCKSFCFSQITAPLALGCGSGESLQGIDCQRNKSKARVKCNNHVRGKKLEKYTTGSLNSYLVDKLLIETHYSSVPDSQKCLSCLEDHNKTGCLLCLPLILMEKDRALCNKV